MKKSRIISLWSMILVMALILAACGGGQEPAEEVVEEPEETTTEQVEEPAEEVEEPAEEVEEPAEEVTDFETSITIWADDTRAPILSELAEGFQNEYGVGLVVEQVADINDQFPIAAPAGEGPDILILAHDRI
ncbi:MAG: hypothetical protein QNJ45_29600, partial [Ardenticatenaceae bacterium]|nr:hypothetical protein [Ardenticatenaceae bacterium]